MSKSDKTIIIGVGNPLRCDDGVGCAVIQQLLCLKENYKENQTQQGLMNTELLDGGTDGLALLDVIPNYSRAIIVDAVAMGQYPGTVKIFNSSEAIIKVRFDTLSTHGFGLAEMLKLAERLQIETKIIIIGIEPQNIDFGEGLSDEIAVILPGVIKKITAFL